MSAIADFISGTVNESLKKLLQPVGLIPAATFVLLNLAFVYPAAREDKVSIATAFSALDAPLQAAIAGLLTLAIGYFLLSASGTILDIVGGQLIRGSLLDSLLVWLQTRRRDYLLKGKRPNVWYVSKRFYLPREGEDPRKPLPSALGNVLVATQGNLERRYGFDMAAFWSQLVATPELKEVPARGVVEDERAARDTLANTAFVLALFGLEGLIFFTFQDEPDHALLSLIAVPAAYIVYRFAVAKAQAWGSAAETFVDLHRDKLHAALKLKNYGSLRAEREVWGRAGRFFVTSDSGAADDVFQREDAPSVTAIPAGDLTIPDPVSAVLDDEDPDHPSWLRWIEYLVLVAKKSDATAARRAEVLVADPRVTRIDSGEGLADEGVPDPDVVRRSDGGDQLLWTLALAPGAAISLRYKLPLFMLSATDAGGKELPLRRAQLMGQEPLESAAAEEPEVVVLPFRGVGFSLDLPKGVHRISVTCFADESRPDVRIKDESRRPTRIAGTTYEWVGLEGRVWLLLGDEGGT